MLKKITSYKRFSESCFTASEIACKRRRISGRPFSPPESVSTFINFHI